MTQYVCADSATMPTASHAAPPPCCDDARKCEEQQKLEEQLADGMGNGSVVLTQRRGVRTSSTEDAERRKSDAVLRRPKLTGEFEPES